MASVHFTKFTTMCSEKDVFSRISSLPNVFVFDVLEEWRIFTWPDSNIPITSAAFGEMHLEEHRIVHPSHMPFCSGYVGRVNYEAGSKSATRHDLCFYRCSQSLGYNQYTKEFYFYGTQSQKEYVVSILHDQISASSRTQERTPQHPSLSKAKYISAVRQIHSAIDRGEVYQVNLSYRQGPYSIPNPEKLWYNLTLRNPSRHAFYWKTDEELLLGNSPELFLSVSDTGLIQSCPIKGTYVDSLDSTGNHHLWTSPKEEAELTMIVDMMRNDLGQVCKTGSVFVEHRRLRRCGDLIHAEQTVLGELSDDIGILEAVGSCFPAASITGAPKKSAMHIIDSLESRPRQFYTGSMGYIDDRGTASFGVTIRTIEVIDGKGYVHLGAGIVRDSDPHKEWEETKAKGKAIEREIHELFYEDVFPKND